jgi:hypothetical protein
MIHKKCIVCKTEIRLDSLSYFRLERILVSLSRDDLSSIANRDVVDSVEGATISDEECMCDKILN